MQGGKILEEKSKKGLDLLLCFDNIQELNLANFEIQDSIFKETTLLDWQTLIDEHFSLLKLSKRQDYVDCVKNGLLEPNEEWECLNAAKTKHARSSTKDTKAAISFVETDSKIDKIYNNFRDKNLRLYKEQPHLLFLKACKILTFRFRKCLKEGRIAEIDYLLSKHKTFFAQCNILGNLKPLWQMQIEKYFSDVKTEPDYSDNPERLFRRKLKEQWHTVTQLLKENGKKEDLLKFLSTYEELVLKNKVPDKLIMLALQSHASISSIQCIVEKFHQEFSMETWQQIFVFVQKDYPNLLQLCMSYSGHLAASWLEDALDDAASTENTDALVLMFPKFKEDKNNIHIEAVLANAIGHRKWQTVSIILSSFEPEKLIRAMKQGLLLLVNSGGDELNKNIEELSKLHPQLAALAEKVKTTPTLSPSRPLSPPPPILPQFTSGLKRKFSLCGSDDEFSEENNVNKSSKEENGPSSCSMM